MPDNADALPDPISNSLIQMGLLKAGQTSNARRLKGGVSSYIWKLESTQGLVCVKSARPKLEVVRDWQAPTVRNRYEVAWFEVASGVIPGATPCVVGHDSEAGFFVMEYLPPDRYPVWKQQLLAGEIDPAASAAVARTLVRIHAGTADNDEIARQFDTDDVFHALRIDPFLLEAGRNHPDVAQRLRTIGVTTASNRRALVHGDVSPKNILIGPEGPVLLDAETAWYGDPAFDVAFCLSHILLKAINKQKYTSQYLDCFESFFGEYGRGVTWEPWSEAQQRAAHLLPGLMLARVDGKSPVEYLTQAEKKDCVRQFTKRFLGDPVPILGEIASAWRRSVSEAFGSA